MNRDILFEYIKTLTPKFQKLYTTCENFMMEEDDTLTEEFQIASAIVDVFIKRAEDKQ